MELLTTFAINVISMLVALAILVTIHEFGHFWVARRCGVKIECFSIGFGKSIYSWTRGETEYRIALLPLGGYVKMFGEQDVGISEEDKHRSFNHKPLFQRSLIVAAGPVANFLLAIALYWFMFLSGISGIAPIIGSTVENTPAAIAGLRSGDEIISVDNEATRTWQEVRIRLLERMGETGTIVVTVKHDLEFEQTHYISIDSWLADEAEPNILGSLGISLDIPVLLSEVVDGGAAATAGLQAGDLITAVNGEPLLGWSYFVNLVGTNPDTDLFISLQREGEALALTLRPELNVNDNGESRGYVGVRVQELALPDSINRDISYSVFAAFPKAVSETWNNIFYVLSSLKKIVIGLISVENLSGPITIAQVAGQTATYGLEAYISFLAILSISLGVFNLLPVPVLDGGHLFYFLIEAVIRRPVPEKIQAMGMQFGVLLIAGIMCIAFYNDVNRFL